LLQAARNYAIVGGTNMRKAFTLVELLIAMALTLLLVYAVAKFYSYVGETVRDGRAQIEMGNSLRAATSRLEQDFAELTVRVAGRIDIGSQQGYLEIAEGVATDSDPDGDQQIDPTTYISTNFADVNGDAKPDGPMLGDCDDILCFTIRSQGEPFVGRQCYQIAGSNPAVFDYQIIRSNLAEVIWFTTFKDVNGDGTWQITEPRYLVRRQLLIVPGLSVTSPGFYSGKPADFFQHNDISAHFDLTSLRFVTNSLGDLSRRENRYVHTCLLPPVGVPWNGLMLQQGSLPNPVQLNPANWTACAAYSLDGIAQFAGEDRILSNVLALDVRVYDPYAALRADNTDFNGQQTSNTDDDAHGVLAPGDAGYGWMALYDSANNRQPLGYGAYVDLWFNRAFANFPQPQKSQVLQNSAYSWAPNSTFPPPPNMQWPQITVDYRSLVPTGPAVWDTWSTAYEKDGLNQLPDGNNAALLYNLANTDWQVDGLDNDNNNGVDDPAEADTRSPYPCWVGDNGVDDDGQNGIDDSTEQGYPRPMSTVLRGIEVRIRVYEPGTRQTRQATVTTDFIPE
jgi:type II secretory pathway pseudopilin PulG